MSFTNIFRAYIRLHQLRLRDSVELYQPTYYSGILPLLFSTNGLRQCDDRLIFIRNALAKEKISTYLDIGSQLGFFVFSLAEDLDLDKAVGIEQHTRSYQYAQSLLELNQVNCVKFKHLTLTPKLARTIESYDLISILSVFHHLVVHQGFNAADTIINELVKRCRYFVFETGQVDEVIMPWSHEMNFMKPNPNSWIESYLENKGLQIIKTAKFPTHLSPINRGLYVCRNLERKCRLEGKE